MPGGYGLSGRHEALANDLFLSSFYFRDIPSINSWPTRRDFNEEFHNKMRTYKVVVINLSLKGIFLLNIRITEWYLFYYLLLGI